MLVRVFAECLWNHVVLESLFVSSKRLTHTLSCSFRLYLASNIDLIGTCPLVYCFSLVLLFELGFER